MSGIFATRSGASSPLPVHRGPPETHEPSTAQPGALAEGVARRVSRGANRPRHVLVGLAAFCVVVAMTQVLLLNAAGWDPWPIVLWESIIGLYFASGLTALWRQPHNPFGTLLILAGIGHWCAGMQTVPLLGLSTIGFLTSPLPLALMIHVILAFPNGRLMTQPARMSVILAYFTSTVLEIPNMLLNDDSPMRLPGPAPIGLLDAATMFQRFAGLVALLLAMTALWNRWITMKQNQDRRLAPFVLYAFTCLIGFTITVVTRLLGNLSINGPEILQKIPELQIFLIAFLPIVFLIGVLTGSFGRTGELREFFSGIGGGALSPAELDNVVASASGIPGCRVVYSAVGVTDFVEADGSAVPKESTGENFYPIHYRSDLVGAIAYRPSPAVDPTVLESVSEASALVISHQRTLATLQAAMLDLRRTDRALRQSRRRIALAGDAERRRIARDLHDGLQQNAIALGMRAGDLELQQDPELLAASARVLREGILALLTELRDLVQGIMPAPLVERGVVSAVKGLAGRCPLPLDIEVQGSPRRLPTEIESTAYFCVLEAITNAVKHANASAIRVVLSQTVDEFAADIADDGSGGAVVGAGSGLLGLRDRLSAFGGTLTVTSDPSCGTLVRMTVPCG